MQAGDLVIQTSEQLRDCLVIGVKGLFLGAEKLRTESNIYVDFSNGDGVSEFEWEVTVAPTLNGGYAIDFQIEPATTRTTTRTNGLVTETSTETRPRTTSTTTEANAGNLVTVRTTVVGAQTSEDEQPYHEIVSRAYHPTTQNVASASGTNTARTTRDWEPGPI